MAGKAAAIGLINLIYNLARYEQIVRLKLIPLRAVWKAPRQTRNDKQRSKKQNQTSNRSQTKRVAMNSITQNLEPKPSIQPRKVVIGGSLIYLILVCGLTCQAQAQTAPRIAIWDPAPGTGADRFALDKSYLEQAAGWMKAGGCEVTWLSAGELADPARLSADRYDGVVFFDAAVPTPAIEPLKDFADSGGVLINLGAGTPFFIRVQPTGKNGQWNYDPPSPRFAWQDYKLTGLVGLKYNYNAAMNNIAQLHEPTELFKRYVPPAKGFQLLLDHYWFPTVEGGEVYPLVRSRRIDGLDLQPQLYIARKGTARAILAAGKSKTITGNADPKVWPWGKETVVAIAQIARDLHRGQLKLDPAWAIKIPDQPYGSIKPLQIRAAGRDTNPEGVKAVRRWGRFDGSGFDLKEMAGAGELPRELAGGASVTLSLPSLAAGPCYVRVRGAYATSDAALKISVGEQVLWHESFVHHTDKGAQNFFGYGAVPIEFQRVAFIPPSITGQTLVLANPGTKPLYFDAVQIESRPATGRSFAIGLGAGGSETGGGKFGPNPLSSELTRTWSNNRFSSRTQYIGAPGVLAYNDVDAFR